ncbi:MAG: NAD(P)-dependent alcohol dehydrogenase [Myxococcales bacterium]|nr:NAD(P)-dependent alcohol dehydrogenase [Myxococcales bacterium]
MRAWELTNGFGVENLKLVERPDAQPGGTQVAVRVEACSLNFRDTLVVMGVYNPKMPLPFIPLSDGAGVVESVGEGVSAFEVGDRVVSTFFTAWDGWPVPSRSVLRNTRGGPLDGMLATRVVADEREWVKAPSHLDGIESATLPCAALTAWSAVVAQGGASPGDVVVVQGTGGVALFALQFALLCGATVVVVSSSEESSSGSEPWESTTASCAPRRAVGARRSPAGPARVARRRRRGRGQLGREPSRHSTGGIISLIGNLGGSRTSVELLQAIMQNVRLQGILVGPRVELDRMCRAMEAHAIRPVIDEVVPFEVAPDAIGSFPSQDHVGKVCIRI